MLLLNRGELFLLCRKNMFCLHKKYITEIIFLRYKTMAIFLCTSYVQGPICSPPAKYITQSTYHMSSHMCVGVLAYVYMNAYTYVIHGGRRR